MNNTLIAVRTLGILVGGFLVASAVLNLFGIFPYSETPPPLSDRFAHSIPLVTGTVLCIPYRRIRRGRARVMIGIVLWLFTLYILGISIHGAGGYLSGEKSWHILPVVVFFSMVGLGNLWAFFRISNQGAPDSSGRRLPTDSC